MAGKGGKTSGSWKPGQSGNPKGGQKNPPRSLHWHVKHLFGDDDRAKAIEALGGRAGAGYKTRLQPRPNGGGQTHDSGAPIGNVNVLAILAGTDRELTQRVFAAVAMGLRDAGGLGMVREPDQLDSLAAPDDGE